MWNTRSHWCRIDYWVYDGQMYSGDELNYIGIGIHEAALGNSLEWARDKTYLWKKYMYWIDPSPSDIKWLEIGIGSHRHPSTMVIYDPRILSANYVWMTQVSSNIFLK